MADAVHLAILRKGGDVWNLWRSIEPKVRPDLSEAYLSEVEFGVADLSGANLNAAKLRGADLIEMRLFGAHLNGADLSGANLSGAVLSGAHLCGARLYGTNLEGAYLGEANLEGASLGRANLERSYLGKANLYQANLCQANLVDATLHSTNLTGAKLWEIQRTGWSIKNAICQFAFWDRRGNEQTNYEEGEFERIFAEKPRIILRYLGGMSPVDLLTLPLVVERLQTEHPGSVLQVKSVQNDAGGASVLITVEDLKGRAPEAFGQELMRIQTKLECA